MRPRSYAMFMFLIIFVGLMFAQDDNAEKIQKEIAAKIEKKKKELEATKKEVKAFFDKFIEKYNKKDVFELEKLFSVNAENESRLRKLLKDQKYWYHPYDKVALKITEKNRIDEIHLDKDFVTVQFYMWVEIEPGKTFTDDGGEITSASTYCYKSTYLKKKENSWVIDFDKEIMWEEAQEAIEKIKEAVDKYASANDDDYSKILTEEWICIKELKDKLKLDKNICTNLKYFDESDFVLRLVNEKEPQCEISCRAWLGNERGSTGKGIEYGYLSHRFERFWSINLMEGYVEYKKSLEPKIKPKNDDEDDDTPQKRLGEAADNPEIDADLGKPSEPTDEEKKIVEQEKIAIQKFFDDYVKAYNSRDFKSLMDLHDLSEETKQEAVKQLKSRKDMKMYFESIKVLELKLIGDYANVDCLDKVKKEDDENVHDFTEEFTLIKKEKKWLIINLKGMWREAYKGINSITSAIDNYKILSDGDISDIIPENWTYVGNILNSLGLKEDTLKKLRFFDEEDFIIKRKKNSASKYVIACKAWLGKGRGTSKEGPEFGMVLYDTESIDWIIDYLSAYHLSKKKTDQTQTQRSADEK